MSRVGAPYTIDDLVSGRAAERVPLVLDVRDLSESRRGHIPGATIVPRRRIEFNIDALVPDRATPLVVVDSGEDIGPGQRDPRAALAAATLVASGYSAALPLKGGVAAWRRAGMPLEFFGAKVSSRASGQAAGDVQRVPTTTVQELQRWREQGRRVALCDVRSAAEHSEGCVPGAVSMPGFEVVQHALDMAAQSDVIVLCSSGYTRCDVAARTLIDLGLGDVVALDGGTSAWQVARYELELGSGRRRVPPSMAGRQFARLAAARLAKHRGVEEIEAKELATLLAAADRNFHAFDLRERSRHVSGHVPRSVSVFSDELIVRSEELIGDREAPVVLIDDDEIRALLTAVWMRRLGHPHVQLLAGGFDAWVGAGQALARAHESPLGWGDAAVATPGLDAAHAARWLASHAPVCVLHVDTGASYRLGHLAGAVWLQRGWLEARIGAVAPELGQPLLVTCVDGTQAAFAAATLREFGHVQVAWLQGGTSAWAAAGLPLENVHRH